MKSFAQRRQEMIDGARERDREPVHLACTDFPAVCIAVASEIGNQRAIQGNAYPLALTHDGDEGDDYEGLRRAVARGIPSREFGGKHRIERRRAA